MSCCTERSISRRRYRKAFFPETLPETAGYQIAAYAEPAQYVSGDLYDCFLQSDNNFFFAMADISGKGVPAAMLASSLKTLLQPGLRDRKSPSLFLHDINRKLYNQLSHAEKFVTPLRGRL